MGANHKIDTKAMIKAIGKCRGNIADAARSLDIHRETIMRRAHGNPYKKMKGNSKLLAAIEEARESFKDKVESVFYDKCEAGENWAVTLYLTTQCKDRGYIKREEISGPSGGTILIRLDDGKDSEGAAKSV